MFAFSLPFLFLASFRKKITLFFVYSSIEFSKKMLFSNRKDGRERERDEIKRRRESRKWKEDTCSSCSRFFLLLVMANSMVKLIRIEERMFSSSDKRQTLSLSLPLDSIFSSFPSSLLENHLRLYQSFSGWRKNVPRV